MFNPPYVVTSSDELNSAQEQKGIEASWAGGEHGIQVLIDFMKQLKTHLSSNGIAYILLISDNTPFLKHLDESYSSSYAWEVLLKREVTGEKQFVIKLK